MQRNKLNLTIDIVALVLFAIVVFTGFSMGALRGAPGGLLWGMSKRTWVHIHEMGSYLLLLALVAHLLFHAQWIRAMSCGDKEAGSLRRRTGKLLMACAALILAASVIVPKTMMGQRPGNQAETGDRTHP